MTTAPQLPPETIAALAKLRDIRLPDPVGWWPLAPGWWALLALICIAVLTAGLLEARRRQGLTYLALVELRGLRAQFDRDADPGALGIILAVLLRRVALGARHGAAALSGDAWEAALTCGKSAFSPPIARFIAAAPYAPDLGTRPVLDQAMTEAERWIRGQG